MVAASPVYKATKAAPARVLGPPGEASYRQCLRCGTTESPKWRCQMTLCNACGLRESHGRGRGAMRPLPVPTAKPGPRSGLPSASARPSLPIAQAYPSPTLPIAYPVEYGVPVSGAPVSATCLSPGAAGVSRVRAQPVTPD